MADTVPVSDVLCEAMEYLSKLGSNLRVRTENLKEKRIRKDKLKNVHAVRKAADKVLLICELSKKSIENVETGLKKILSNIIANQSTEDGGKTKNDKSNKCDGSDYIIYKSRKLKIRNKINLKHYMSVNVLATAMNKELQDRYPVYHDCNLYRMRKRIEKSRLKDIENVVEPDGKNDNSNDGCLSGNISPVENSVNEITECTKDTESKLECSTDTLQGEINNETEKNTEEAASKPGERVKNNCKGNSQNDILEINENNSHKCQEKKLLVDKCSKNTKVRSDSIESVTKNEKKTTVLLKKKKFKHIKFIEDSSESDQDKELKDATDVSNAKGKCDLDMIENCNKKSSISEGHSSNYNESVNIVTNKELCEEETNKKPTQPLIAQSKELSVDTSGMEPDIGKDIPRDLENDNCNYNNLNTDLDSNRNRNSSDEKSDKNNIGNEEKSDEVKDQGNEEDKVSQSNDDIHDSNDRMSEKSNESRPLIKCVNINKLLKENIKLKVNASLVEISDSDNEDDKNMHIYNRHSRSRNKIINSDKVQHNNKKQLNRYKENKINKEEEYWIEKRREAKKFIPKTFCVDITRLPKLSEQYLLEHNLKKITQNGIVVCESHSKSLDSDKNDDKNTQDKNDKSLPDVNIVKNALLNDSDSDKSHTDTIEKCITTIDNSINADSDTSIRQSNETLTKDDVTSKDTNKCNNDNTYQIEKQKTSEADIIKSALMQDTSEEELDKSVGTRQRKSESITPSKRKHIMESMHAKKMLLTYTSSSDTEDEQLRNALKEIRKSLLEETVDDTKQSDAPTKEGDGGDKNNVESEKNDTGVELPAKKLKRKRLKASDASEPEKSKESDTSTKDTNSQAEENSNSSSKKMSNTKSKGNGSSSNNSDIEDQIDKDIDGLTNLKTLIKKPRRRRSSSTESPKTYKTRSKMPKAPQISEEGFLQAESSSDAASVADSDTAEDGAELPSVPAGLNGDGIGHLAKDDLLGDSDSSSSHRNKDTTSQDTPNNESSDENVTSKRRKANAISSDSEVGSSRPKERGDKDSDFEDSDAGSETAKRTKRKKKGSESDGSDSTSVDGSKKKRRRIKNIDESDGSGSESENEGRNKHGRKNIRKVMGKNQLEEATKKAAREEKERIARIAERQKVYNNLEFDESGKPDEVVLDKVVLDFDPETKEPLIEVDKGLVKKLKPHQANGIKFMWDACFESVKRIKKDKGSGCILAHCMGLGKTLQVVSLTHTLLTHGSLTGVRRVLVVCPLSTVLNWVNEFRMWLRHAHSRYDLDVYELSRYKQNSERASQLQQWFQGGGVCVLGYEMFRNLSADNVKKFKKKMLRSFQESLVDPGPDLVVCDEGHLLKNEKTSLSQAMNRVCTLRRIVLTGTPLQNNLKEYYCMVQFVKPNLLGKYNEYLNRFVNPITNGQYTDSTEHDIRVMKRRSHVLHKMLDGAVQRRDYGVLAPFLPPKHEYVLFITLSEVQIKLYQEYLDNYSRRPLPGKSSGFLFPDFQSLQRIWTHPLVLKYNSERYEIMQQKKREREEEDSEGSLVDFIDDDSSPEETSSEDTTDESSDAMSDDSRKKSKKKKSGKKSKGKEGKAGPRRGTRANPIDVDEEEARLSDVEVKHENPTEWWVPLVRDEELEDLRHSHKLVLLFEILRQCEIIGDKLLVFSQSLYSLDLIEHFLGKVDEATQEGRVDEKLNGHVGSWSPGVDYFRLDGSTSCENRSIWCKNFNREDNPRARLFLISTRAGGLGINLVAANRVVIFDVSWNPSHDVQSIFRVYRFGQKKPCYVYRFLAMGTMEEKIYERQVTKQAISKRVIDEQQIDRHYAENDLAELYKFEPHPPSPRELPPLPRDRLFAEMLREHEAQIYKYHEHDSLLENKEEETLTEEERKAAWEDFENEKTRPPPAPFPGPYGHNGMVPGLLAQQQQHLAYAALAAMLRKDMPNVNDNQIRDMIPMLYQANPQLMQKMGEILKYVQPNMMNPGMMNPVMNSGGGMGMGMGMGGSSGLQYEPPWQRQQQQQHQMRLQQLLQQQQNVSQAADIGAKLYAGGLGSRDPVAMALQQQRAREMMLGERQRPRGRPPARPAPAPADVVNLDSD